MAKLAEVKLHLSVAELAERFRNCDDAVEKIRWQVIWLRAQGRGTAEVAEICGYNRDWVHQLVRRYNAKGPQSLQDGRRSDGKKRLMSDAQLAWDYVQHLGMSKQTPRPSHTPASAKAQDELKRNSIAG